MVTGNEHVEARQRHFLCMVPSKPTTTTMSPTTAPSSNNTQTSICGEKLEDFCNMHDDIQLNVWLTITASIIVVISL
ncbi:hypothetical protein BSL78_17762, partial [Apostichopus japonicus]